MAHFEYDSTVEAAERRLASLHEQLRTEEPSKETLNELGNAYADYVRARSDRVGNRNRSRRELSTAG